MTLQQLYDLFNIPETMCSARLWYLTSADRASRVSVRLFHRGREVDQMPRLDVLRLVPVRLQLGGSWCVQAKAAWQHPGNDTGSRLEYQSEVGFAPLLGPIYGNWAVSNLQQLLCILCIKSHVRMFKFQVHCISATYTFPNRTQILERCHPER